MVDIAIFLGAGASKADGAPLQGELFKEYFSSDLYKFGSAVELIIVRLQATV